MKLRTRAHSLPRPDAGFSMIELLIVVGLIVVMAAIGLPNLIAYLRQAKVRGAMQQVAGELQSARNKAIVKNTNEGVAFAVMDADTYRFIMRDDPPGPPFPGNLGPIHQLPPGVTFLPGALGGIAFDRLGRPCAYGPGCIVTAAEAPTQAQLCPTATGDNRICNDNAPGTYISQDAAGNFVIQVRENTTQLTRWVQVAPGGRVVTQR